MTMPSEPVMIRAAATALFGLLASLGLVIAGRQQEAIIAVALIVIPLLQGVWTRRHVFAPATVVKLLSGSGTPADTTVPVEGNVADEVRATITAPVQSVIVDPAEILAAAPSPPAP
jgi:hypothetical protein